MIRGAAISLAIILLAKVDPAVACSSVQGNAESWIKEADVIIRARAAAAIGPEGDSALAPYDDKVVSFDVLEVLKGGPLFSFVVRGFISDEPHFNDRPVPYDITRRGGGSCYSRSYQLGGEYLLLLKEVKGRLTPYWASLAATNEQLRGVDDPWLQWVRRQLESRTRSRLPDNRLYALTGPPNPLHG